MLLTLSQMSLDYGDSKRQAPQYIHHGPQGRRAAPQSVPSIDNMMSKSADPSALPEGEEA